MVSAGIPDAQPQRPVRLWREELPVEEQPGVVPDPDAERLPAAFERQLVFFRTAEPPGTVNVYRIHGTNQPQTIGHAVSSDCFRCASGGL